MWSILYQLASPRSFYQLSGKLIYWFGMLAVILFALGLYTGLVLAPQDYQQGDAFRIMYIHVPSAFLSLFIYALMATCAVLSLVWKIKLADIAIKISAYLGAWITFLALFTGSLWGKPMWGTWWIWDARLTSELILLFLYLGIIALQQAITDSTNCAKAVAILILVGFVDIPIIHYSVYWWNTLHQGATIAQFAKPAIAPAMLYPLLIMLAAFFCYFISLLLLGMRREVLLQSRKASWVRVLLLSE